MSEQPKRIQRKRTKGYRLPENAVYVGRPTRWGNPFKVGEIAPHRHLTGSQPYRMYIDRHRVLDAAHAAVLYRAIVTEPNLHQYTGFIPPVIVQIREALEGRDLACWCPPDQPCHADILLELAAGGEL